MNYVFGFFFIILAIGLFLTGLVLPLWVALARDNLLWLFAYLITPELGIFLAYLTFALGVGIIEEFD